MPAALAGLGFGGAVLDRQLWVWLATAAVAPLSWLPDVDQLRHTSLLSLACVAGIALMVVAFALGRGFEPCEAAAPGCRGEVLGVVGDAPAALRALPIFVFAFTCHQNIFSITNELREPSRERTLRLVSLTVCAGCLCFLVVAAWSVLASEPSGPRFNRPAGAPRD